MASFLHEPRLSIAEAARLLSVHSGSIWRWILRGVHGRKLPSVMVGGRRYILQADLEAFIAPDSSSDAFTGRGSANQAENAGRVLDGLGVSTYAPCDVDPIAKSTKASAPDAGQRAELHNEDTNSIHHRNRK